MPYLLTLFSILLTPYAALAAAPATFRDLVGEILSVVSVLVPFVIALTIVVFLWNIARTFVFSGEDAESVKKGRTLFLWGVIVLVVMLALWGILALLRSTFFGGGF